MKCTHLIKVARTWQPSQEGFGSPTAELVAASQDMHPPIAQLPFRQPSQFRAGEGHNHIQKREKILTPEIDPLRIKCIRKGVKMQNFCKLSRAIFRVRNTTHSYPHPFTLRKHLSVHSSMSSLIPLFPKESIMVLSQC